MADLSVTGPDPQSVRVGEKATFKVEVSGGTEPYSFTWKKGTENAPNAKNEPQYEIPSVTADSAGTYSVDVKDKDGKTGSSASAELTVKEKEGEPLLWNRNFALGAFVLAALVLGLLLIPIWITAARILPGKGEEAKFSGVIATQAVIVGALAIMAGIYFGLLEFRGRARTIQEIKDLREAEDAGVHIEGWIDELAKVLPQSLKAFGDLSAAFATMLVGVILFICATAIAWKAAPDNAGANTGTTSTGQQPPPPAPAPPPPPVLPPPPVPPTPSPQ